MSKPIIHRCKQGTEEWLRLRAGIPTASELDAIISPEWEPRKGQGVQTYLCKKLAERWTELPLQTFSGGSMQQGSLKEEEALSWYEFTAGEEIDRVGFVTTANGKFGCSPDGLIGVGGIECKSPEAHTHCGYLLKGDLPKDYAAQVHGSMYATGAPWWKFLSYSRNFPSLLLTVNRDEEIISKIHAAVEAFGVRLDAGYETMVKLNGGKPKPLPVVEIRTAPSVNPEDIENYLRGN